MAHAALTLFFIASVVSPAIFAAGGGTVQKGTSTEFIRTWCGETRYPTVCFTSLSAYAGAVQQSHSQLARIAISVSLSKVKTASFLLSNLSNSPAAGREPRARMALHDCTKTFSQARTQMMDSLNEFQKLYSGNFRWHLSNVQTWMSAALTNEQTCMDGFQGVTSSAGLSLKAAVANQLSEVSKVTSNALALVNCLAARGSR